jgi:flagellar hook-associated protein 2
MSSITAPSYDPTSTATAMAQKTTSAAQQILTGQTSTATATQKALSSLSSAISAFQSSLGSLTGFGKTMLASSASLSDTTIGTASAKPTAAAGTYSLFVDRLATASQVSYTPADGAPAKGSLTISLAAPMPPVLDPVTGLPATTQPPPAPSSPSTASFTVDLTTADTDGVPGLSVREVAAAINNATGNAGQVSAGVVTLNSVPQLVLTSKNTGAANTVWASSSVDPVSGNPDYALGTRTDVATAQDALIHYGSTAITQPSNTFTNIDGVSMTLTRAQAAGEKPFTLTVGSDSNRTVSNVQAFVDAYNKLKSAIDSLVNAGDPANGTKAGAFAHDAGVRALQSRLVSLVRPAGSTSLASYGIIAARDGTLSLDSARLSKQLAVAPTGLDKLIGSATLTTSTGLAGSLNTYLNTWSNSTSGQITSRTDANNKLQSTLTKRQDTLDAQYNTAYERYLKQFTDLQALQSTMNSNVSMFDALFGNDKSN